MQHAATCQDSKLCMVYTLSPLAFRQASDKSSSFSSRNLSPMVWPSLLICPGHPNKNEATLCLSHMRLFWERNFKVATGHTQLENSHLFRRAFCLIIRAIKFTVFFRLLGYSSQAPQFLSVRSRNGSESQVRSNTLASHVLCKTTRLEFAWRRRYRTSRKQSPYSIAPDPLGSDRKIWMWLVCFKNSL